MIRGLRYIVCVVVALLALSCKQDELCYDHTHYPYVELEMDLSQTDGLSFSNDLHSYSVIFFPYDDGIISLEDMVKNRQVFRVQSKGDLKMKVMPGLYDVVIYSDYSGQISFGDTDKFEDIYAQAISSKVLGKSRAGVPQVAMPEDFVVAKFEKYEVKDYGKSVNESMSQPLKVVAVQATETYKFELYIENADSMKSIESYMGLIDSKYYITQQRSNNGSCEMYVADDDAHVTHYPPSGSNHVGLTEIEAITFGFTPDPSDPDNLVGKPYIYFMVTLMDGKNFEIKKIEFDLEEYNKNGKIVLGSRTDPVFSLPKFISGSESGDGGFIPEVEDWDKEEEIGPYYPVIQ